MSEIADEPDAGDSNDWRQILFEEYLSSRFRRVSGARQKTRDLTTYTAYRVELAYPDRNRGRRFRRLPPPIRAHLTLQFVVGIVGNGGVEYLLDTGMPSGGRFGEVVRDLRLTGATEAAERLAEVYRLFPSGLPRRSDLDRQSIVEQLREQHEDVFDRADTAIWDAGEAACRVAAIRVRLAAYLLRPRKRKPDPMNRITHYQPL